MAVTLLIGCTETRCMRNVNVEPGTSVARDDGRGGQMVYTANSSGVVSVPCGGTIVNAS